ncbi:MAG: NAD-dependent epimerase/dehydratase family protein [Deltaproteobacteria bacterium]|nr:NAD-dependent epimerase/dehydratase family protein [Deltaproteobacteria bacterium]
MRVAVAGGSGFVGQHVVQALRDAGHRVRVLARRANPADDEDDLEHHAVDVGAGSLEPATLAGCDAVVNLIGIKAPRDGNDFERAHIHAVGHLLEAARQADIARFIHVSVAQTDDTPGAYASSKREGERLVTTSDRAATVLRPGLVYGPGDDAVSNLVTMIRLAPVVPVPRGATGPLPAIDVRDVAAAVVASLARPQTAGQSIDLVGPEALDLRALVRRVASALALPTHTPGIPDVVARLGARVMEALLPDPLLSRSQLLMLSRGLPGDAGAASRALGVQPRALEPERIRQVAAAVDSRVPSLRLITSASHRAWLREQAQAMRSWPIVLVVALVLMLVSPRWIPDVWWRMTFVNGLGIVGLLWMWGRTWPPLLRPRIGLIGIGVAGAALAYLGAALFIGGLRSTAPALAAQVEEIYGWSQLAPVSLHLMLLPLIVVGEDLLWRGAITLPLANRFGPGLGVAVAATAFAVAHLTSGPLVLVFAAAVMGALWSALMLRTRSLVPVFVSHLLWDVVVMFVYPP